MLKDQEVALSTPLFFCIDFPPGKKTRLLIKNLYVDK